MDLCMLNGFLTMFRYILDVSGGKQSVWGKEKTFFTLLTKNITQCYI